MEPKLILKEIESRKVIREEKKVDIWGITFLIIFTSLSIGLLSLIFLF